MCTYILSQALFGCVVVFSIYLELFIIHFMIGI